MSVCTPPLPHWPSWRAQNCCTSTRVSGSVLHYDVDDVGWWVAKVWQGIVSRISGTGFLAVVPPGLQNIRIGTMSQDCVGRYIVVWLYGNMFRLTVKRPSSDGLRHKSRIIIYDTLKKFFIYSRNLAFTFKKMLHKPKSLNRIKIIIAFTAIHLEGQVFQN
jgi:hypothetical protein